MKFFPLIWAGLWRKPTRTFFTFLSIVVAFVLFGVLAGINIGFSEIIEASRLNRLYVDRRYGTQMPRSYLEQIKAVPGVKAIGPSISVGGFWQEKQNNVKTMIYVCYNKACQKPVETVKEALKEMN